MEIAGSTWTKFGEAKTLFSCVSVFLVCFPVSFLKYFGPANNCHPGVIFCKSCDSCLFLNVFLTCEHVLPFDILKAHVFKSKSHSDNLVIKG